MGVSRICIIVNVSSIYKNINHASYFALRASKNREAPRHKEMKNIENIAIALGGNIGNVSNTLKKAVNLLKENGVRDIVLSSLYTNPAADCIAGTPDFTNAALIGKWDKSSQELLSLCQSIETKLGRPKNHTSYTSRIIDLDILLFGDKIIDEPNLQIPHKRAHERSFVLIPLSEIAGDWIFPDKNITVKELTHTEIQR